MIEERDVEKDTEMKRVTEQMEVAVTNMEMLERVNEEKDAKIVKQQLRYMKWMVNSSEKSRTPFIGKNPKKIARKS